MSITIVLLIIALVCAILALFEIPSKVNLTALGLLFVIIAMSVGLVNFS